MHAATLSWDTKNNPISSRYHESYFSTHGGLEESRYVFLEGNNLKENWQDKECFVIAECGFGTGLNFLATVDLFKKSKHPPKQLFFISIENEPLRQEDLKKAHKHHNTLKPYAKKLYAHYPSLTQGFHFIEYDTNIKLLLCFYDIKKALSELICKADAWFLDGFSPAKNPSMWTKEVFRGISNLSKQGTTLATYSAAGVVKQALEKNGFKYKKHKGFGDKRHMIQATCTNPIALKQKPWFLPPSPPILKTKKALILGAGIAGTSIAYLLAKSGWEVAIIDKNNNAGLGASGNHCGVVAPLITKPNIDLGRMYERSFLQSLHFYDKIVENEGGFYGVKHYAYNKTYQDRWSEWSTEENKLFNCEEDDYGKYFNIKKAGYVQPFKICQKLLQNSPNITFHKNQEIENYTYKSGNWYVKTKKNIFQAPLLIMSLGIDTIKFLPNHSFALQNIRGQVTLLPKTLETLKPICDKGYICPCIEGKQVIGATYKRDDLCNNVRNKDNEENLASIGKFLPQNRQLKLETLEGRVSFRLSSNDRFPIIGNVHDEEFYKKEYKSLPWTKHKPHLHKDAKYLPNLFISTAHGSRGLTSASLGANILFSLIEGLPLPIEKSLFEALHPARFTLRRVQKQEVW